MDFYEEMLQENRHFETILALCSQKLPVLWDKQLAMLLTSK
jgi:hypothetical protein